MGAVLNILRQAERRVAAAAFCDLTGDKGWWSPFCIAPRHAVRHVDFAIPGWPILSRPLRVAFLADLHLGSHTGDIARLNAMMAVVKDFAPDLGCLGGDYTNNMLFGRGRIPPATTASIVARAPLPLGWLAALGDHDLLYGAEAISRAFEKAGITPLSNQTKTIRFDGHEIDILGLHPLVTDRSFADLLGKNPTIVLAHDPAAFVHLPDGPHLMLSGHTHGGQIQLPSVGPLINMSRAPLRWSHGSVIEKGRYLYVTSGVGCSGLPIRLGIPPEVVLLSLNGSHPLLPML